MRSGDSKDRPVIAPGKFQNLSSHVTLGLGDPNGTDKQSIIYEELHKETTIAHSEYVFATDVSPNGNRRKLIWCRTIRNGLFANSACMDAATVQLGVYFAKTGRNSIKKVGKLSVTAHADGPEV